MQVFGFLWLGSVNEFTLEPHLRNTTLNDENVKMDNCKNNTTYIKLVFKLKFEVNTSLHRKKKKLIKRL